MPILIARLKPVFWTALLLALAGCSSATDARQASCDTLVMQTRAVCLDMIRRGLDVSCNSYLGAVATAMKQADGSLFDVGEANVSAADSFCSTYVDKLRDDRDEHADSMQAKDQTGPECNALAERFDTRCMANLGKQALPGQCKNVGRTFMMGATRKVPQEQLCSLAGMQLPEK